MEIHNHGNILKLHSRDRAGVAGNRSATLTDTGNGVDSSAEVQPQRLIERLEGDAEVRNRLLVEIQAKIQAGEYLTRVAAERAAEQIVG